MYAASAILIGAGSGLSAAGGGGETPGIIKYLFWKMTAQNPKATYACVNWGEALGVKGLEGRSILLDADIGKVFDELK